MGVSTTGKPETDFDVTRHLDPTLPREERIRRAAHELWRVEGEPNDKAEQHWRIASALVDLVDGVPMASARLIDLIGVHGAGLPADLDRLGPEAPLPDPDA